MTTTPENCIVCAKEHAAHEAQHKLLNLPLHTIDDGWLINNNATLYLQVRDEDGKIKSVLIDRKKR